MAVRIAVIGAGYFAHFHQDAWMRLPGAELVGICDLEGERAAAAAAIHGVPAFTDREEMFAATKPDLVDIATPPASHLELVTAAAKLGLPVICQKPLAPTLAEAEAVVAAAERAGTLLVVHENFRFQPWYREMWRLLAAGSLGNLHCVSFRLRPGDGQGAMAYLDRQPYFQRMERFLVHETAIHFIDTFRFLLGEVSGVTARLRRMNPHIVGEDAGIIIFEFAAGQTGLFDGNRLNEHVAENTRLTMGEMWLEASAGVLRLDGGGGLWWKPHGGAEAAHDYGWSDIGFGGDSVFALQAHVLSHLRDGTRLENSGRDYLRNLEIEEAVYRSAKENRFMPL
ncbi:MAG: Gfo/Idh/MocA family oxidoreductase [Alphaproteobacteria bacterium]